jgi:hypothetical protein
MSANSLLISIKLKPPNTFGKYFSHLEKRTVLHLKSLGYLVEKWNNLPNDIKSSGSGRPNSKYSDI